MKSNINGNVVETQHADVMRTLMLARDCFNMEVSNGEDEKAMSTRNMLNPKNVIAKQTKKFFISKVVMYRLDP